MGGGGAVRRGGGAVGRTAPHAREAVASEIADVAIYLLRLADVSGVELGSAVREKLARDEERFRV